MFLKLLLLLLLQRVDSQLFSETKLIFDKDKTEKKVLTPEKTLDKEIVSVNQKFTEYKNIFQMKQIILPNKTILKKGTNIDSNCKEVKEGNLNCFKIEQFDQELNDKSELVGDRRKILILFFDESGNLKQIASRIYSEKFFIQEKKIFELIQNNPLSGNNINENLFIRFVTSNSSQEIEDKKFQPLKDMDEENRKSFKSEAYLKHLKQFMILLDRITVK